MKIKELIFLKNNFIKYFMKSNKIFHFQNEILNKSNEVEWANIYHDSIRGKEWVEKLPINIGRWAGNYSFFYILNRILSDYKPKRILELGLGESSKFISAYLDNYLSESTHHIVEHDSSWIEYFNNNYKLSKSSNILITPLIVKEINGFKSNYYSDLNSVINGTYDLYIIDGPYGSNRFSRYNIISLIENLSIHDDFIIIMDDTHRVGENDTVNDLMICLKNKNIKFYKGEYNGCKSQTVITSSKYQYAISL
jgi:hypothetical protein